MEWSLLEIALAAFTAVIAVASPFLVMYARRGAQAAAKLADVTLTDEQLKQLDVWVTYAISFVEEQVRKRAKGLAATAMATTPVEKRELAIKVARELAPDDLRQFTDRALEMVIDAKVQDRRVSVAPAALARPSLPPPAPLVNPPDAVTTRRRLP
jgi:hypothetical protein